MSKLPVLMYHNVSNLKNNSKGLTISESNLEAQFCYLAENNYKTFHFSELQYLKEIPNKSVSITFDDVTENQLLYAVPLLKKYHLKATFFIAFAYLGKTDLWNKGNEKIMSIEQLKTIDNQLIEFGLHSFSHFKYTNMSSLEIQKDFDSCFEVIEKNNLQVFKVLAYPFGNYPKKNQEKKIFFSILEENSIHFGLKIGNRVNSFPFKNPLEIKRIDIKGEDSLLKFKIKLRIGKLKLF
jgi:peptidoglycan/xylan/chitin deacetylase (PgdA/CDA1 family)